MKKSDYFVIGVMSGTSLDGIDLAYIHFAVENNYNFEILEAQTVDYSKNWREKLDAAIDLEDDKLQELNKEYTKYLAEVILEFVAENWFNEFEKSRQMQPAFQFAIKFFAALILCITIEHFCM